MREFKGTGLKVGRPRRGKKVAALVTAFAVTAALMGTAVVAIVESADDADSAITALEPDSNGTYELKDVDGQEFKLFKHGENRWKASYPDKSYVNFTVKEQNRLVYEFGQHGLLPKIAPAVLAALGQEEGDYYDEDELNGPYNMQHAGTSGHHQTGSESGDGSEGGSAEDGTRANGSHAGLEGSGDGGHLSHVAAGAATGAVAGAMAGAAAAGHVSTGAVEGAKSSNLAYHQSLHKSGSGSHGGFGSAGSRSHSS